MFNRLLISLFGFIAINSINAMEKSPKKEDENLKPGLLYLEINPQIREKQGDIKRKNKKEREALKVDAKAKKTIKDLEEQIAAKKRELEDLKVSSELTANRLNKAMHQGDKRNAELEAQLKSKETELSGLSMKATLCLNNLKKSIETGESNDEADQLSAGIIVREAKDALDEISKKTKGLASDKAKIEKQKQDLIVNNAKLNQVLKDKELAIKEMEKLLDEKQVQNQASNLLVNEIENLKNQNKALDQHLRVSHNVSQNLSFYKRLSFFGFLGTTLFATKVVYEFFSKKILLTRNKKIKQNK